MLFNSFSLKIFVDNFDFLFIGLKIFKINDFFSNSLDLFDFYEDFFSYNFQLDTNILIFNFDSSNLFFFLDLKSFFFLAMDAVFVFGVFFNYYLGVFLYFAFDIVECMSFFFFPYIIEPLESHRLILEDSKIFLFEEFIFLTMQHKFRFFYKFKFIKLSYIFDLFFNDNFFSFKFLFYLFFFKKFSKFIWQYKFKSDGKIFLYFCYFFFFILKQLFIFVGNNSKFIRFHKWYMFNI